MLTMQTVFKGVNICQLSFSMFKKIKKSQQMPVKEDAVSPMRCGGCCISNEMQLQRNHMKKVASKLGFRTELLVEVV